MEPLPAKAEHSGASGEAKADRNGSSGGRNGLNVRPDATVKPVPCSGSPLCGSNHNRRSVPAHRGLRSETTNREKDFRCRSRAY